ncbi:MAG: hypothetical protein P4L87_01880 [Formivibrio sp.]|nr:hypothetical protein [Formivibrio sp.]
MSINVSTLSMTVTLSSASQSAQTPASTALRNSAAISDSTEQGAGQETVTIRNQQIEELTYSKPTVAGNMASTSEISDQDVDEFLSFISQSLAQQGLVLTGAGNGQDQGTVDQATVDAAKAAIGEDGEMGVKNVSEQVLSLAKSTIGSDPTQLKKIRDAVELGFAQAKEELGGTLPDISQKTHDAIMAEFDRWEKDGIPQTATASVEPSGVANGPGNS